MDKIKIVRIIARLNIGGPAVNASILSSSLDKERFSTKVIHGSLAEGEGDLAHLLRENGVETEFVPELGRDVSPLDDITAFFKIFGILRRTRPDIVHTHTAKAGTLGRLAAIACGVKVKVHTFHGHVFRHYFGAAKTRLFIWIERFLGLFTDRVIVLSPKQKEELVKEFGVVPESKCAMIPLGVDLARLRTESKSPDLRTELGFGPGEVVVGILGRLVPVKNHRMFLLAAAEVGRIRPDIKTSYMIVGDGELRKSLEAAVLELGLEGKVRFTGWRTDLSGIYRSMDIMALTSLNEGTPLALIEAMAMGKAIVATNVGGIPDIIDDGSCGFLTEKDDVRGFAERLISLMDDKPLREKFGKEGIRRSQAFAKERLVSDVQDLYINCVKEKSL